MSADEILKRRAYLLENKEVPLMMETTYNLGARLGNSIIDTMSPKAKKLLNRENMCPETLWISPSDRLQGKCELKPPITNTVLKALTHQFIFEQGCIIEEKIKFENAENIKKACAEVELFERFEANHRIHHHLKQQHFVHMQEMEDQRILVLDMFQEERQEMIDTQKHEWLNREKCIRKKFKEDVMKKVQEAENFVRRQWSLDKEQFDIERQKLLRKIEEMKADFERMLQEIKEEFSQIIQQLFKRFKTDFEQQNHELNTQHVVELMHLVITERSISQDHLTNLREELKREIDELQRKNEELINWQPELTDCPNVKIWKAKCWTILKNYEKFVEYVLKEKSPQGRFVIPIEELLECNLSQQKHSSPFFDCSYPGGYINQQPNVSVIEQQDIISEMEPNTSLNQICECETLFLPKEESPRKASEPFVIGDCKPKLFPRKDNIPETIIEEKPSLDSIYYKNRRYLSTKALLKEFAEEDYWEKAYGPTDISHQLFFPNESKVKVLAYDKEQESSKAYESADTLTGLRGPTSSAKMFTIEELLNVISTDEVYDTINSEVERLPLNATIAEQSKTIKNVLTRIVVNLFDRHQSQSEKKYVNPIHTQSVLLSAVDSIELISQKVACASLTIEKPKENEEIANELVDPRISGFDETPTLVNIKPTKSKKRKQREYLHITNEEYLRSLQRAPIYMLSPEHRKLLSIWDYQPANEREWQLLIDLINENRPSKLGDRESEKKVRLNQSVELEIPSTTSYAIARKPKQSILRNKMSDDKAHFCDHIPFLGKFQ